MHERQWPLTWRASWVDSGEAVVVGKLASFDTSVTSRDYRRARFEREFTLDEAPAEAPCRLTADSRYRLIVNDRTIGRGPVRGQPDRLHYDCYDLSGALHAGVNRVQVEVTFYGAPNPFWQPAREDLNYGRYPLLLLEAELGSSLLITDESWQVRTLAGWSLLHSGTGGVAALPGLPMESFDARVGAEPSRPVRVPITTHYNGGDRIHPPSYPYGRLLPRPIGPLTERPVHPREWWRVHRAEPPQYGGTGPVQRVDSFLDGSGTVERLDDAGSSLQIRGQEPTLLAVDFGRIVVGRLHLSLRTGAPSTVSVAFQERFDPSGTTTEFAPQVAGCQLHTASGPLNFDANEINGFRWLLILLETDEATLVQLDEIGLTETVYAFAGTAGFDSEDTELVRLYQAGRRTVEVNSLDAFIDCPTREQRAWTGDGWIHAQTHLTCSDDWRLARRYLELADSPRPDGLLPMTAAGDGEYAKRLTIPDWSLYWIHGLYRWYEYAGDREFLSEHLPSARRVLAWYAQYLGDDGLVGHLPEWSLVDWSAIYLDGRSSIINGLLARSLDEFARMADYVGNAGDAAWATGIAQCVRDGFDTFWDAERDCYLDHVDGATTVPSSSQLANAAALLADAVPPHRRARVLDSLVTNLVTRSWIGGQGDSAVRRAANALTGRLEPDWDVETEHVRAQPFGSALVHEALLQAGRIEDLVADVRTWNQFLTGGYDTFGESWEWGTPCHGWSSCPTADLVRGVLGVTPLEPGFTRARIAPRPDLAPGLAGSVPTPFGQLRIACRDERVEVASPVPFDLVLPNGPVHADVPAGEHTFDVGDCPDRA